MTRAGSARDAEPPINVERPAGLRRLLDQLGVRPSKALGQNFLHEQRAVRRIVEVAEVGPDDLAVEVGPGLGVMTRELAQRARQVIAIELDTRLAAHLRESLERDNVEIVQADVLATDIAALTGGQDYLVVANLPYSVATAAIRHLLETDPPPQRLVVMVQREVAERMVATPPRMSILAVAVQLYGAARIAFRLGSGAFLPAPKVESAVVRIDVRPRPLLRRTQQPDFFRLVQAGFGQRRKSLENALSAGLARPKATIRPLLVEAEIDPVRRAETLTIADWLRLYQIADDQGLFGEDL